MPSAFGRASIAQGSVTSTKLKVSGIDLFSAGDFSGGDGAEDIVMRDAARGIYKRVIVKDDRLIGAVLDEGARFAAAIAPLSAQIDALEKRTMDHIAAQREAGEATKQ